MDSNRSPSAFYLSENSFFPGEVTYCKSEVLPDQYGTACRKQIIFGQGTETACRKQVASSLFDHLDPFALHDQRVDLSSDLTALRTSNGTTVSARIPPSENSLFSSSLPELYSRKLEASSKYTHFDRSVVAAPFNNDEEEPLTSLEEIEAQTIGNLLPDDDDLFGGVTDGLERVMQPNNGGDVEELDFFCNMGGMDLGDCDFSTGQQYIKSGTNLEEHPFGEHPSRMLLVRNVNSNVEDSELRTLFEQYGDICNLYTASKQRGFVKISYYDLRAAQKAMKSLQKTLLRGNRIDIHYSIPKDNPSKKEKNQGILIASNLDCSVSNDGLRNIFCIYGDIKEIQSVSRSNHQKLIGFFDSRAAESALRALHGSNIAGKQIKLEPVGIQDLSKLPIELQQQSAIQIPFLGSPVQNGISSTVPDSLENKTDYSLDQLKFDTWGSSPNLHPRSLGEYRDGFMNGFHSTDSQQLHRFSSNGHPLVQGSVFGSVGNGSSPRTGHGSIWGNSYNSQSPSMMWPSYDNGIPDLHRSLSPMLKTALHSNNHHIGSAPAVNPTIWDRHQPYAAGSPETSSIFHSGSWGNSGISKSPLHLMDFVPHNIFSHVGGNCTDPSTVVGVGLHSHHQRCMMFPGRGQRLPGLCPFDPPNERVRIRRASSQADKKHFELDIERIIQGEDSRTTLMIKNIPNKYTSKMLLAAIDELHRGTYDFIYLPIDFKNKCNVGYAFINMTDPSQIIPFYKAFNGKKWEKFNSEKVASLAYARIQGKAALLAHFQNSSLMNEDKRCRPILFNTGGPNAGDQVPFPMGVNVRSRAGKTRISSLEEKIHVGGDHSYSKKEESTSSDLEIPSK